MPATAASSESPTFWRVASTVDFTQRAWADWRKVSWVVSRRQTVRSAPTISAWTCSADLPERETFAPSAAKAGAETDAASRRARAAIRAIIFSVPGKGVDDKPLFGAFLWRPSSSIRAVVGRLDRVIARPSPRSQATFLRRNIPLLRCGMNRRRWSWRRRRGLIAKRLAEEPEGRAVQSNGAGKRQAAPEGHRVDRIMGGHKGAHGRSMGHDSDGLPIGACKRPGDCALKPAPHH